MRVITTPPEAPDVRPGRCGRRRRARGRAEELPGQQPAHAICALVQGPPPRSSRPGGPPPGEPAGGSRPLSGSAGHRTGEVGPQTDPVVRGLRPGVSRLASMVVVNDRCGLVDQGVPRLDDVEEGGEVVPTPSPAAGAQCGVEAAQLAKHVGPEGHVGAGSERTRGVGEERVVGPEPSRSKVRVANPLPKPPCASIIAWPGVSSSAGQISPVTQPTRSEENCAARLRTQLGSTTTSSSVKATTGAATCWSPRLCARARPATSSCT